MIRAGELEGFEFDVEGGRARVTGYASWSERQYCTIVVTEPTGNIYSSVRPTGLVRAASEREGHGNA